ncbi:MAG: hypothetical protein IPP74_13985, partial [Alphaproteobacteria bacterium]|nr:hypothetical protein [Alphaproteobacteria bacterium]
LIGDVVDYMNSPKIKDMVVDIECIDCSDIASSLLKMANGKGYIIEVTSTGKTPLILYENGEISDVVNDPFELS